MNAQLRKVFGLALLFALVFGTVSAERAVAQILPAEDCPAGDTIQVNTDTFLTVVDADTAAKADPASPTERERTMEELFNCAIANPGSTVQFADGAYDNVEIITIGNPTDNDGDDPATTNVTEKVTFQGNTSDREAVKFTGEVNFRVHANNVLIQHITFENTENVGTINWPSVTETFEIEQDHLTTTNDCRKNVEIRNCVFRNTRSNGVSYDTGVRKTCDSDGFTVADSLFENIGYNNEWEENYGPGDVGSGIPKIIPATVSGLSPHMVGSTPHHISGSHTSGIRITGANTIKNVTITGNTIDGTTHSGMLVHRVWGDGESKIEISDNIVSKVPKSGIHVLERPTGTVPDYDLFIKNNFVVNSGNSPWLVTDYGWYADGFRSGGRYVELRTVISDSGVTDKVADSVLKPEIWSVTTNTLKSGTVIFATNQDPPVNIYDNFGGAGAPTEGRASEYSRSGNRVATANSQIPASRHSGGAFTRNRAASCIDDNTATIGKDERDFACFSVIRFLDPHAFGAIHLTGVSTDGDVEIMENELRDNTLGLLLCGGVACYFDSPYAALGAYYVPPSSFDLTEPDISMNNIYGQSRISEGDLDELPAGFAMGAVYASIGPLSSAERVSLNGNYLGTDPALFRDPDARSLNQASAYSLAAARLDIEIPIALITAAADEALLTLTYSKTLDSASVPAAGDFAVVVDGTARNVASVAVNGAAVTLTLASAVETGDEVTISYTPGDNPIRDASERNAIPLTDSRVTTGPPPPTITTAAVIGNTLTLTYNENLDSGSVPVAGDFAVRVGGSAGPAVTGVAVSGAAVTLTLASAVEERDEVTVSYTPGSNPIRNAAEVNAVALTNSAVTNSTPPPPPPALTTAAVDGDTLTLTYNETLDSGSVPVAGDFTVMVDGTARNVASVAVSGEAVTLTLASAVEAGDTVIVSYTPGTNPIRNTRNASVVNAGALTDRAVTNNTPPPLALSTTTVVGNTLTLTYNQALDEDSVPAAGDFTVMVEGEERDVTGVSVSGSAVRLTLASAVEAGDEVTVSYTHTGTNNKIRAASGGEEDDGIATRPVRNDPSRPGPPTGPPIDPVPQPPVITAAAVVGSTLTLTYNEALDSGSAPAAGDFTVMVEGEERGVTGVSVSGTAVTLTLASAVEAGDEVTVSYTPGTSPIRDASGENAVALTDRTVRNNTSGTGPPSPPSPPGGGGGGGCSLASGGNGVGLGMLLALMVVPFGFVAGRRAREAR